MTGNELKEYVSELHNAGVRILCEPEDVAYHESRLEEALKLIDGSAPRDARLVRVEDLQGLRDLVKKAMDPEVFFLNNDYAGMEIQAESVRNVALCSLYGELQKLLD